MAVSKRLRHEVMRRDNHQCRYCGATAPDVKLTIDHVTPVSLGGQDVPQNLVTACVDCNAGKSATPPDAALVAAVDEKAVEWAQAMQVAVEQRAAELAAERGRTDRFDQEWRRWNAGGAEVWRAQNWRASVLRLLAAGLTDDFLVDAIGIAMRSKAGPAETWRYFCGVCWREIDKIQSSARDIVGRTPPPATPESAVTTPRAEFDFMAAFDAFLDALVPALGGSEQVRQFVDRLLWDAMPEANKAFDAALLLPRSPDLADDEDDAAPSEAGAQRVRDMIAQPMEQVAQWRKRQQGAAPLDAWATADERWQALDGDFMSMFAAVRSVVALMGGTPDEKQTMVEHAGQFVDCSRQFFGVSCDDSSYVSADEDQQLLLTSWKAADSALTPAAAAPAEAVAHGPE